MPLTTKELKPCTILSYSVSRHGGQRYERENEFTYTDPETGEEIKTWDTKKVTRDKKEFDEASSIQAKAKREFGKRGAHSPLGVVMRRDKRNEAERVVDEWEAKIVEFNRQAKHTTIDCMVMVFDVEGRNVDQLEKVLDQMFDVLGELREALETYDPENIRTVLRKVSGFSEILPEAAAEAFERAVESARKKANEISKYDKRAARIAQKIEEAVSGQNPDEVLAEAEEELAKAQRAYDYMERRNVPELRKRVFSLKKLMGDKEDSLQKLAEAKANMNRAPIDAARFAVMRRMPDQSDDSGSNDATLQGAESRARFAGLRRVPTAANDA